MEIDLDWCRDVLKRSSDAGTQAQTTKGRHGLLPNHGSASVFRFLIPLLRDRRFKSCPRNPFTSDVPPARNRQKRQDATKTTTVCQFAGTSLAPVFQCDQYFCLNLPSSFGRQPFHRLGGESGGKRSFLRYLPKEMLGGLCVNGSQHPMNKRSNRE